MQKFGGNGSVSTSVDKMNIRCVAKSESPGTLQTTIDKLSQRNKRRFVVPSKHGV